MSLCEQASTIADSQKDIILQLRVLHYINRLERIVTGDTIPRENVLRSLELIDKSDDEQINNMVKDSVISAYFETGDFEQADALLSAKLQEAEKLHDHYSRHEAHVGLYMVNQLLGDWNTARYYCETIKRSRSPNSSTRWEFSGRVSDEPVGKIVLEYQVGNIDSGDQYLSQRIDRQIKRSNEIGRNWPYSYAISLVYAMKAYITGVLSGVEAAKKWFFPSNLHLSNAVVAILSSDKKMAVEMYEKYLRAKSKALLWDEAVVQTTPNCIAFSKDRILGLLAGTIGKLDAAVEHFERALEVCEYIGCRPKLGWTHRDYAELLLRRDGTGDKAKALSLIRDGLALAQEFAMRPLAERLNELHSRVGETTRHPAGLTAREIDVLRRLAAGSTNQEIGYDLKISEHTVGNHVRRILRKIGVTNRVEAATFAVRHGLVPTE